MADFPALPLWTDAYLADTRHLSTLEHGAYLLLIMEAWRRPTCSLPDDDTLLARLSGLTAEQWADVKPVVMSFWKRDGRSATWRQKRLSAEHMYVADKSRKQRDRIAKRWNKTKKDDTAVLPDGYRIDTPTPTPTYSEDKSSGANAPIVLDETELFRRGKEVLGPKAGGVISKLKRHSGGIGSAYGVILEAAGKENPMEWVQAVMRRGLRMQQAASAFGDCPEVT